MRVIEGRYEREVDGLITSHSGWSFSAWRLAVLGRHEVESDHIEGTNTWSGQQQILPYLRCCIQTMYPCNCVMVVESIRARWNKFHSSNAVSFYPSPSLRFLLCPPKGRVVSCPTHVRDAFPDFTSFKSVYAPSNIHQHPPSFCALQSLLLFSSLLSSFTLSLIDLPVLASDRRHHVPKFGCTWAKPSCDSGEKRSWLVLSLFHILLLLVPSCSRLEYTQHDFPHSRALPHPSLLPQWMRAAASNNNQKTNTTSARSVLLTWKPPFATQALWYLLMAPVRKRKLPLPLPRKYKRNV